jgi:hypothetical protein
MAWGVERRSEKEILYLMTSVPKAIWRRCQVNDVRIWSTDFEGHRRRKTEFLGEKSVPMPLFLPQISRGLAWHRTRGPPVAGIKRKTSSTAPALFHIDEGDSRILRNVLYYLLLVGWDEDDLVAERIVVGTIPI